MAHQHRGNDPGDLPIYPVSKAAQYIYVPLATLRAWAAGRRYPKAVGGGTFGQIIKAPQRKPLLLSFTNLAEAHVLAAIRNYGVKLPNVYSAIELLQNYYGIDHPLADGRFKANGFNLFVEHLGKFVDVNMQGQPEMREVMRAHLQRVEHDSKGLPARLFLFSRHEATEVDQPRTVMIDPRIAFGRPVLSGTGIPVAVLADRHKAGDPMEELAADYNCDRDMIEKAIRYEFVA